LQGGEGTLPQLLERLDAAIDNARTIDDFIGVQNLFAAAEALSPGNRHATGRPGACDGTYRRYGP